LPASVEAVALFVGESMAVMKPMAQRLGIRTVQYYGDAPDASPDLQWIPAFSIASADDVRSIAVRLESLRKNGIVPKAVLVDAHVPGMLGGTGVTAPWRQLADFRLGVPVILAGGLTPDNVGDAIRIVRPFAVDVASGVESSPGKKDADKVRRFIDAVRNAAIRA
jgi:phosphoribosylanthranilate isomerase